MKDDLFGRAKIQRLSNGDRVAGRDNVSLDHLFGVCEEPLKDAVAVICTSRNQIAKGERRINGDG